jgi:hypothetical protein
MPGKVKEETSESKEEAEINELAKKIKENNLMKLQLANQQTNPIQGPRVMARPGQPNIMQFCSKNGVTPAAAAAAASPTAAPTAAASAADMDEESQKGRFGWYELERQHLPYIFRHGQEKFTSVRMVERRLLAKFLQSLPAEVKSCTSIKSYYITDNESKLLNEINVRHADSAYGKEAFTTKDLVVKVEEAEEFYKFLHLCHKKLVARKSNASDRCGFLRINGESVVPYTIKNGAKFVPLFYFEGETSELSLTSNSVSGWDLAYLKFCCKVQGIRNELFNKELCKVVALDEIKSHFPQGTTFEDYWPANHSLEPAKVRQVANNGGNWTQRPGIPQPQPQKRMASAMTAVQPTLQQTQQLQQLQQHLALQQMVSQQLSSPQMLRGQQVAAAVGQRSAQAGGARGTFPGKLTQIKEFPVEMSSRKPYKMQKALIHEKIVPCINIRPYSCNDLMITLPDFLKHFFPDVTVDKCRETMQEILKIVFYKGNKGHQEVLRGEGKCSMFDPVPLILVKDVMSMMTQIQYVISGMNVGMVASSHASQPPAKRVRVA